MAIKQQICLIKKYVTCVMAFTCVTRCQFYCIISPILFTKNNKLWNDKSENFLRIWLSMRIWFLRFRASRFIKEGRKSNL